MANFTGKKKQGYSKKGDGGMTLAERGKAERYMALECGGKHFAMDGQSLIRNCGKDDICKLL